ncbi:MAG TPA: carboxymuconolactone decarboxylase family protein [Polyangiaceae bacterium]|nr:carboxymuconolactone decarboxylase family protein [Polyangiaceae bacterium]
MSRIPPIEPATAPATVAPLLAGVQQGLGMTPNLFRVAANSPAALEALVGFFGAVSKGRLDARTREAIALTVSEIDACDYCLSAHSALGKRAGLDEQALADARLGKSDDSRRMRLLGLARAIVDHRGRAGTVLDEVREAGISDAEVIEVAANVALTIFTNYLNELAATDLDFPVVRHHPR